MLAAPVTSLTAGGLSAIYAYLQLRVGLHRLKKGIKFGEKDNGKEDQELVAKVRAGANMAEYVPMGLVLMLLMETTTPAPRHLVAAYGAAFAASRLAVAYALTNTYNPAVNSSFPRKYGFLGTFACLVGGGIYMCVRALKTL